VQFLRHELEHAIARQGVDMVGANLLGVGFMKAGWRNSFN